jgi:uncharacterized protein YjbI with pentapeptide repeats
MKIEIKNRYNGTIICSGEFESLKQAVEKNSADLSSADLRSANLGSANLGSADLSFADLSFANLSFADLGSADLRSADLSSANLSSANLRSANLGSANLNKEIYYIGNIGNRNDFTLYNIKTDEITCGCWRGNLKDLNKRVIETYKNKNKLYYKEYANAIKFFKNMRNK